MLALQDRAHERAHRRGVRALEEVRERLLGRESHVLLLQRQSQLLAEGAVHAPRRHLERAAEADARLDGGDEHVDQLGHLVVDLLDPHPGATAHEDERPLPAGGNGDHQPEEDAYTRVVAGGAQPEPECRQCDRREHAVAHQLPRREPVDARGAELTPHLLLAHQAGPACDDRAEGVGQLVDCRIDRAHASFFGDRRLLEAVQVHAAQRLRDTRSAHPECMEAQPHSVPQQAQTDQKHEHHGLSLTP